MEFDKTMSFEVYREENAKVQETLKEVYDSLVEKGYNSGYAQFFIVTEDVDAFNDYYTAFGKVIEGMDIVDKIKALETTKEKDEESGETTQTTKPVNPPVISNVTVDTFGVEYGEPETHKSFDMNSWFMNYYSGGTSY